VHVDGVDVEGAYGVVRLVVPRGDASPRHVHTREDEVFVVVSGRLAVTVADREHVLGPGDSVTGPVGVPHAYRVVGDEPARFLVVVVPGGFEQAFHAMDAGDPDALADAGIELLE